MIGFWMVDEMSCVFLRTDQLFDSLQIWSLGPWWPSIPPQELLSGTNREFRWMERGQYCQCRKIQKYKNIKIQKYKNTKIQKYKFVGGKKENYMQEGIRADSINS